ncbi:MAG TPA: CotH kinase family protein [Polyangia bacterium]
MPLSFRSERRARVGPLLRLGAAARLGFLVFAGAIGFGLTACDTTPLSSSPLAAWSRTDGGGGGAPAPDAFEEPTPPLTIDPEPIPLAPAPAADASASIEMPDAGAADAGSTPAYPPLEDGLPTIHLWTASEINSDDYTPALLHANGHTYQAEAKFRGASSLDYPKKSYTLKFERGDRFNDARAPGGFFSKRKVVLYSSFDDNSYLRTVLAFSLWNRLQGGRLAVEAYHAVIYLDGQYHGLYTVLDFIDEDFFARYGLGDEGQLFKAVGHASFYSSAPAWTLYEKKAGLPEVGASEDDMAFAPIDSLRAFVRDTDPVAFTVQVPGVIDLESYVSWFILVSALEADDTFGKNTYQYLPSSNHPWHLVPWDFNASFGQDYTTARQAVTYTVFGQAANTLLTMRLYGDPVLGPALRERYVSALQSDIEVSGVVAEIQTLAARIAAAAARDEERWGDAYRRFPRWSTRPDLTTHRQEVAYLLTWVVERWAYLRGDLGVNLQTR